jgi:hypothetical protein
MMSRPLITTAPTMLPISQLADILIPSPYFEEHPELVERYNIKHSPIIIVDDEVVFNGMPSVSTMKEYFFSRRQNDSR